MAVREAPEDERMRCYLGREYMFRGEWQKCVDALTVYLSMPSATWGEERGAAMGWIANALRALNRPEAAFAWHLRAVAEAPHMREPLVDFARFCHDCADWPMALFLAEEALKILRKSDTYVNMDHAWDATPEALAAAAAWRMGLLPGRWPRPECGGASPCARAAGRGPPRGGGRRTPKNGGGRGVMFRRRSRAFRVETERHFIPKKQLTGIWWPAYM
jgi:hypothetical protein